MQANPDDSSRSTLHRALWSSIALGGAFILLIAATLEPAPEGHGTHTQLGLPPCGFLSLTGSQCPGCGLTTAFAHAVRGNFTEAASANLFGLLLFVVVCAAIPLAVVATFRAWSIDAVFERFAIGRWALAVAGCGAATWFVRLAGAL